MMTGAMRRMIGFIENTKNRSKTDLGVSLKKVSLKIKTRINSSSILKSYFGGGDFEKKKSVSCSLNQKLSLL